MKKILCIGPLTLLMVMCVGVSSCSDGMDGFNGFNDNSLIGLWYFVNATADIQNPTDREAEADEKAVWPFASLLLQGSTFEFKADKTFFFDVPLGDSTQGSYTKNGNQLTLMHDDGESGTFIISLKNGVLTMIDDQLDNYYRSQGFTKYEVKMTLKKGKS